MGATRLYSRVEARDFDEIALALKGMKVDLRQLSGGPFHGEVEVATVGAVRLMRTTANRVIQARGAVLPGTTMVSLVTPRNDTASWRGQTRAPGDLNVNAAYSEVDHLTGRNYENLTLIVDTERLRSHVRALTRVDVEPLYPFADAPRPSKRAFAALANGARAIFDLARTRANELQPPTTRNAAEAALLARLVEALVGSRPADATPAPGRHRIAGLAEEFMRANLDHPLPVAAVCEEFDVSERTLRYAFRDRFGTSPQAHFRALRLNAIRREIVAANGAVRVQQLARRWGFVHLGKFAADYRGLFGELPSATARSG